jgi:long-chain fatty acid transport protein
MKYIALTAVLFCFTSTAFGSGYQLRYQGAEAMGTGFSSAGSYGDSLSSIYYNPGLFLTQDKNRAVSLELMAIYPTKAEFTSSTGTTYDDFASTSISGAFYFGYKVDDKTAFTVALTTPWGTSSDYDKSWDGRYHALETDLAAINLQTMFSKQVSDKLIFSIGPQIQQLMGALSTATPTAFPNDPASDLVINFDADNMSVGGVLALTYMPTERTTIGFNYTSRIKHTLRGDFTATPTNPTLQDSDDAQAEITTPDVFTLGATHSVSEKLLAHLSVSYTNWSVFKELTVSASDVIGGAAPFSNTVAQDWDDTYMVALGSTYKMSPATTLRGGLSYETGAVENAVRTPRSQDADRIGLGLGASFMLGAVKLDLGLNHIFYQGDISLAIADVPPATVPALPAGRQGVTGSYDNSATLLRAGLEYVF